VAVIVHLRGHLDDEDALQHTDLWRSQPQPVGRMRIVFEHVVHQAAQARRQSATLFSTFGAKVDFSAVMICLIAMAAPSDT
jgi:hypothetical protein